MDLQNMDLKGGSLQISTEVIGKIARCAALEVDGVSEVSCGKQNKKVKELLAAASIQPPVTVEMRDGTAELTHESIVPELITMTDEDAQTFFRLALTSEPAREFLRKRAEETTS